MKNYFLVVVLFVFSLQGFSQMVEPPFGKVAYADIEIKSFPADTSANAIVLNEIGQAFVDIATNKLIYDYYVKIKILNRNGLKHADFDIPLYKSNNGNKEMLLSIMASTYNLEGVSMKETKLDNKKVFTENFTSQDSKKFAMPDVREGSVLEVRYRIESPFGFYFYNFREWEFQSEMPKVHSRYEVMIPDNYVYTATLRGYLPLTRSTSEIYKDCFVSNGGLGEKSACVNNVYEIYNIPAFKTEEFMTSRKNFVSAVYFELAEVRHFDGRVDRFAKTWKDVEQELQDDESFGRQIKKAKNIWEDQVKLTTGSEPLPLKKAKTIYEMITGHFTWNEHYGKFTEEGVKKANETKKGNCADINLSLVGALQAAGLKAFPVLVSTRENGLPVEIHPVISGFNYVVASVEVDGVVYLLDATYDLRPFGMLPIRCLNGKGRLLSSPSDWVELKPKEKQKTMTALDLTLAEDGHFEGKISITSSGYDAMDKRYSVLSASSEREYEKTLQKEMGDIELSNLKIENLKEIDKPVSEKADVKIISDGASNANTIFFSPFMVDRIAKNPFTSSERLYPVDYGAPLEQTYMLTLTIPETLMVDELPKSTAQALPAGGGKYLFNVTQLGNKISILTTLSLTRPIYNSAEYHYIKELYARIMQIQASQIVFKKK